MYTILIFSGMLSILSIFMFFGNAFSSSLNGINMFQVGNIFLLIWQILIMVVALIAIFVAIKIHLEDFKESTGAAIAAISCIMSFIAAICSFCYVPLCGVSGAGLGVGPILYAITHIIIFIVSLAGLYNFNSKRPVQKYGSSYKKGLNNESNNGQPYNPVTGKPLSNKPQAKVTSTKPATEKDNLTENEKADLILKYKKMLDDGIINQEEFDKKKKDLLS